MRRPLVTRIALSTFVASSVVLAIACGGDDSVSSPTDDAGTVDAATSHDATVDQSAPDSSGCSGGTVACGGACIDTKVDPSNCGACGKVCAKGELCSAGTCATSCGADLTECGGDAGVDLCISTKTDNANCGNCSIAYVARTSRSSDLRTSEKVRHVSALSSPRAAPGRHKPSGMPQRIDRELNGTAPPAQAPRLPRVPAEIGLVAALRIDEPVG